jgi:hypothetical protein
LCLHQGAVRGETQPKSGLTDGLGEINVTKDSTERHCSGKFGLTADSLIEFLIHIPSMEQGGEDEGRQNHNNINQVNRGGSFFV